MELPSIDAMDVIKNAVAAWLAERTGSQHQIIERLSTIEETARRIERLVTKIRAAD